MSAVETEFPAVARPSSSFGTFLPFFAVTALAVLVPFSGNDYWVSIATRAAIYWVLISGLNLVVGYAGQLAIGYVVLLSLGAYTTSVLVGGIVAPPLPLPLSFAAAMVVGAVFGLLVGLPALRLRTFYFAMSTLGFATIVGQIALAWQDVTGGGIGIPGPALPAPLDTHLGLYLLCLSLAATCTWLTWNVGGSRFGRALVAIRDAEIAAEAAGISKTHLLVKVFILAGALAGLAGGLFATLQTYITPEAFSFDLTVLFFIAILIGGRGSIAGPLIGTVILTVLPEVAAPLAAWSTTLYAVLLLLLVLVIPGGIASLIDAGNWRALPGNRAIRPKIQSLAAVLPRAAGRETLSLRGVELHFGGLRAIAGLDLDIAPGQVHGLIGPNGSGKTTTLNVISGYYRPQQGTMAIGQRPLPGGDAVGRARLGIARTFQTPRVVGEATVLENVMIGAERHVGSTLVEAMLTLPRHRRAEAEAERLARCALEAVGLAALADIRADRVQHSELRFMEIARALVQRPDFLLLDEPAAGLSADEILRLGALIRTIASEHGVAVLLVEHHADLIFDICDRVTVLNLGAVLAQGTPPEIRSHKEVVSAYLGA